LCSGESEETFFLTRLLLSLLRWQALSFKRLRKLMQAAKD